ncbi:MAG: hypothetical protein LUQ25_09875, partial [Methanoregulaceae archaeon]|nr:hypothetical protein [Methanoregulaceae archaeon]
MKYVSLLTLLALSSIFGIATAGLVSQGITYQGILTDNGGNPLTGTYSVAFRLYGVATGGTALSTDTHSDTARNGKFTTTVTFDLSKFDGRALWLGIKRVSVPEKTPRSLFRPVPYALGLRPGAVIKGSGLGDVLKIVKSGKGGAGIEIISGPGSTGILAKASGDESFGLYAETTGNDGGGLYADVTGDRGLGVYAHASGEESGGV